MATKKVTQDTAPHAADGHDVIRVQGARQNNLQDIDVELPKRRLTVFTGVSGSGKSSLVFSTIAAESQRMINETYSAFVQGFMPTQVRYDLSNGVATQPIAARGPGPLPPRLLRDGESPRQPYWCGGHPRAMCQCGVLRL